jgi:hypothetical protein
MSVDQFVFLREVDLPTTSQWQSALDELAAKIQLDPSVEPRHHAWYWPASVAGAESGFEFFHGTIGEAFGGTPPDGLNGRDHVVNFVTHADIQELRCAMYAAAALVSVSDGRYFDEESSGFKEVVAVLEEAGTIPEN